MGVKSDQQWQACSETAATQAPLMEKDASFGKAVLAGLACVYQGGNQGWAENARKILEPLAEEAVALPSTVRDHRFELYQNMMGIADAHNEKDRVAKWGDRWLQELDATQPANDEERSALDIARVDIESVLGNPARVLPALIASEHAMPDNYNASLRLGQMENAAKDFDAAIAACRRGLAHATGPLGRSWLLQTEADALSHKGETVKARRALEEALRAAEAIPTAQARHNNIARIQERISRLKD